MQAPRGVGTFLGAIAGTRLALPLVEMRLDARTRGPFNSLRMSRVA
jgi:hypothetical protein